VACLSAGGCGTEWLAHGLREFHPELEVEHEPLGPMYKPRLYFRRYADPAAILKETQVRDHVRRLERTGRPYVETGWPLLAALPLLAERMARRLRVVHLTRHPVPSALLHLAAGRYAGSPHPDDYARMATLGPQDANVFQGFYARSWGRLSPYERCLFWWTEVSLFAIEFPGRNAGIPFLRVKAEDLMGGRRDELERLLDFIGCGWHPGWLEHSHRLVDRWHEHAGGTVDALEVHRHPTAVEAARQLGYDITGLNAGELQARYRGERFDRSA
jgi:hypothetical protein